MRNSLIMLFSIFSILSCDPHNRIERHYHKNKSVAVSIHDSYKSIEKILPIRKMIFRNSFWREYLEVTIIPVDGPSTGLSFDNETGDLLYISSYPSTFEDSLMKERYLVLDSLARTENFKAFVMKVIDSKFRQIEAQENYFFITMGDRAKHSSHPDMQTGLLFTTDEKYLTYWHYTKKIDDNVYIYESVVP
jgi:hypothetical protein